MERIEEIWTQYRGRMDDHGVILDSKMDENEVTWMIMGPI